LWENFFFFFDELLAVQNLQRMTEGTLAGIWVLTRQRQNRYRCALSCSSYVLTSVCEEGFVLSWNWVLLGQTEMQE
jgi:hypothetical protein